MNKKIYWGLALSTVFAVGALSAYRITSLPQRMQELNKLFKLENVKDPFKLQTIPGAFSSKMYAQLFLFNSKGSSYSIKFDGSINHGLWYILSGNITGESKIYAVVNDTVSTAPIGENTFSINADNEIAESGEFFLKAEGIESSGLKYSNNFSAKFGSISGRFKVPHLKIGASTIEFSGLKGAYTYNLSTFTGNNFSTSIDELSAGVFNLKEINLGLSATSDKLVNFNTLGLKLSVKEFFKLPTEKDKGSLDINISTSHIAALPLDALKVIFENKAMYPSDDMYTAAFGARLQEIIAMGPRLDVSNVEFSLNSGKDHFKTSGYVQFPVVQDLSDVTWSDKIEAQSKLDASGAIADALISIAPQAFLGSASIKWDTIFKEGAFTINGSPATPAQMEFILKTVPAIPGFFMGIAQSVAENNKGAN